MVNIITAKEAAAIANKGLPVNEIRKLIFDGIYNAAKRGNFSFKYLSRNKLPSGIPLELVSLGYQVIKSKYTDDDGNYSYTIYWGTDVEALYVL